MFKSHSFQFRDIGSAIKGAADMAKNSFKQDPQLLVVIVPVSLELPFLFLQDQTLMKQKPDLAAYKEIKRAALQDWEKVSLCSVKSCRSLSLAYRHPNHAA